MKTNKQLAYIVAERVSERVFEDLTDLIADITADVISEYTDLAIDSEEAWETLMDVSGRLYIGAQ